MKVFLLAADKCGVEWFATQAEREAALIRAPWATNYPKFIHRDSFDVTEENLIAFLNENCREF
jgi:hypothetical protein